jgi:hypothetical protein
MGANSRTERTGIAISTTDLRKMGLMSELQRVNE